MGRIYEIINILLKPIPKGFKIWILANEGYILDFIWHAKGNRKGLINLDMSFINNKGFLKI